MRRRDFLRSAGLSVGALALPAAIEADPYAPLRRALHVAPPVRIRGRVTGAGRPLAGVRVSDGTTVVRTDAEGRYTLVADSSQPFVFVCTPRGWQPARDANGLAAFFAPITADAEQSRSFDLVPRAGDARHAMLVLADPQVQIPDESRMLLAETVPAVQRTVRELGDRATVGIALGDIVFDQFDLYPDWERAAREMGVPFYQAAGNHDLDYAARTTEGATATFRRHFGPPYYSVDLGAIRYIVLHDVFWSGDGYLGYVDARQLDWLAQDLATLERGAPVVVLQHIPPYSTNEMRSANATKPGMRNAITNREALYRLLEPYRAHLVSGHMHEMEHVKDGGATHLVAGAVCGAWWTGPICYDGTPSGYLVLVGDDAELRWRYQATGQPADHQLRVHARGSDPTAPDEVPVNVWSADDRWTITWVEDGAPKGALARRTGKDPLSVELHAGKDKPAKHPWVDPAMTAHMYYARPAAGAREIVVEARDGWGNVYRERRVL